MSAVSTKQSNENSSKKVAVSPSGTGGATSTSIVSAKQPFLMRKYLKIKKAAIEFWIIGKYGFRIGAYAGLALGFVAGSMQAVEMRSFWPIPISMIGTSIFFGGIFALSTVLKAQDGDSNDTNSLRASYMKIIQYDPNEKKYKQYLIPAYCRQYNSDFKI